MIKIIQSAYGNRAFLFWYKYGGWWAMEGGREMQLRVHSFIRKENTPFWREKHLRIPDHLCGWLKLEEEPEVSRNNQEFNHRRAMHVKKRSSGVKTQCKFEQVLNINLNVWSAKGSTAHLQQVYAVLVLCALVQWICAGDIIKIKERLSSTRGYVV